MTEVELEPISSGLHPDIPSTTLHIFFHGFDDTAIRNDEKVKKKAFMKVSFTSFLF